MKRVHKLFQAYLLGRKSAYVVGATDETRQSGFPEDCQAILRSGMQWDAPVAEPACHQQRTARLEAAWTQEALVTERLRLTVDVERKSLRAWELARGFVLIPDLGEVVPPYGKPIAVPLVARDTLQLDVLLLALLADRSPRYRAALAAAEGRAPSGGLLAETALHVAQPHAGATALRWDLFDPRAPLVEHGLLIVGPAESPAQRTIRIDPRIADYLLGKVATDVGLGDEVRIVAEPYKFADLGVDPEVRDRLRELAAWQRKWAPSRPPSGSLVLLFHGPYGSPMLAAVRAFWIGETRGRQFLAVDAARAPSGADWLPFVRRVYREAKLHRLAVAWQGVEGLLAEANPARWETLVATAADFWLPTFLASETAWDPLHAFHDPHRFFVRAEFPIPGSETRRKLWVRELLRERNPLPDSNATKENLRKYNPLADPRTPDEVAQSRTALDLLETFQFTEGQIADALATARGLALGDNPSRPTPTTEQLYEACRRQAARRLVSFTQRLQPRPEDAVADDRKEAVLRERVVLPEQAAQHLVELFRRMSHLTAVYHGLGFERRLALGRGLVALFTGPSGTGKTHAAATLASLLRKDLYKVEMAAVVSKFVGETEKNLGRVFADAQDANAVLFFDEADALFGKRGEVEQAQDRWANLEVNYLLQRVEEYTGTVILATNFRQNIDEAFLRRVQMLMEFPLPNAAGRLGILTSMFRGTGVPPPNEAQVLKPIADRFDLTGGNLKNVVLDAVFRAVASGQQPVSVSLEGLVLGVAREYQKLGKPITAASFGKEWYEMARAQLHLDGK